MAFCCLLGSCIYSSAFPLRFVFFLFFFLFSFVGCALWVAVSLYVFARCYTTISPRLFIVVVARFCFFFASVSGVFFFLRLFVGL